MESHLHMLTIPCAMVFFFAILLVDILSTLIVTTLHFTSQVLPRDSLNILLEKHLRGVEIHTTSKNDRATMISLIEHQ